MGPFFSEPQAEPTLLTIRDVVTGSMSPPGTFDVLRVTSAANPNGTAETYLPGKVIQY